jgi:hypothetical protein
MRGTAALIIAVCGFPALASAGIYTCTDADGRTVFRDAPCPRGERSGERVEVDEPRARAREQHAEAPLERKQVEQLLARLDKALGKRDRKAVLALFAKDAVVEVELGDGKLMDRMQAQAFARYLATAFSYPGYVYRPKPARISLSKTRPRATAVRTVREAVPVAGTVTEMDLQERVTIERDGRRLLIRKLRKTAPAAGKLG